MSSERNRNMFFPIVFFVLLAGAFVGVESIAEPIKYETIHPECLNYDVDENGDNQEGMFDDTACHDYPYEDGAGETPTPAVIIGQSSSQYQPYYDLSVDFMRYFVGKECQGSLNGCVGTNFQYESQFYCFMAQQMYSNDLRDIMIRFYQVFQNLPDDGSVLMLESLCYTIPKPPPGNLPVLEDQQSTPLPQNPNGGSSAK